MKLPKHLKLVFIYELRPGERCGSCEGEIHPTSYGQFTQFVLDTRDNKAYHGDCAPMPRLVTE